MDHPLFRCFLSIELPKLAVDELEKIQNGLSMPEIRRVSRECMHLTIKFLGNISIEKIEETREALSRLQVVPFFASFGQLEVFPNRHFIRGVWMSLEPKKHFQALHSILDSMGEKLGFPCETRFHPHVTLCRFRSVGDKQHLLDQLLCMSSPSTSFLVGAISLQRSFLTEKGPHYEELFVQRGAL